MPIRFNTPTITGAHLPEDNGCSPAWLGRRIGRREWILLIAGASGLASYAASIPNSGLLRDPSGVRDVPLRLQKYPLVGSRELNITENVHSIVRERLRWRSDLSFADYLHWLSVFGDPRSLDYDASRTRQTMSLLTNEPALEAKYGQAGVIVATPFGARFLSRMSGLPMNGRSRPSHPYQELAVFGSIGLPSSYVIQTSKTSFHLQDVLVDCLSNLQLRETSVQEPEWATQAIAHYLPPGNSWKNRWGESISLDSWVRFLISRGVNRYSCGGTHFMHSLALLLQANEACEVLSVNTVGKVLRTCKDFALELESTQHEDGSWRGDWSDRGLGKDYELVGVHLTGHILEAQSYMPQEVRISSESAAAGLRFLAESFHVVDDITVQSEFCFFSHAGKVLLNNCREFRDPSEN